MLKRPKFLKFLIISYFVYLIISLIEIFILGTTENTGNTPVEKLYFISNNYLKYFSILFMLMLTAALFYNLLALTFHGWILQLTFSIYYIFLMINKLSGDNNVYIEYLLGTTPEYMLVPWGFFNGYIIYYFLTPEIRSLFFNRLIKQKVNNEELLELLNNTKTLISSYREMCNNNISSQQLSDTDAKHSIKKHSLTHKVKYLPTARVLITEPKHIEDINELKELNKIIYKKSRQIILMLSKILPALNEKDVIDHETVKYYQTNSWTCEDIIEDFKLRAVNLCADKRQLSDKIFSYSKKVDELELLKKTAHLMENWLNETGNEIGDLIKFNDY